MFKKAVVFCDFIDRLVLKCFIEGVFVGIFSLLAMFCDCIDGICAHNTKILMDRRNGTIRN